MTQTADLLALLDQIARLDPVVRLLNEYKGVPVVQPATVEALLNGALRVRVHPDQAVCLALERETVLQSALFSLAWRARVGYVSVRLGAAMLNDFEPAVYVPESRREIRVRPATPVEAQLRVEDWDLPGHLLNISVTGVAVYLPTARFKFDPQVVFQKGQNVQVEFQLATMRAPARLAGRVAQARLAEHSVCLGLGLAGDPGARLYLGAYTRARQEAVLPELAALHASLARSEQTHAEPP